MGFKETVAIIGAASQIGTLVAKGLANTNYRMLLMDQTNDGLLMLQQEICQLNGSADIDIHLCSKEVSWEADIIIFAIDQGEISLMAEKIKEVATCKIILFLTTKFTTSYKSLQELLPLSKVAGVSIDSNYGNKLLNGKRSIAAIEGKNDHALATAKILMAAAGFEVSINFFKS